MPDRSFFIFILLLSAISSLADDAFQLSGNQTPVQVTLDFETRIVQLYSEDQCGEVLKMVSKDNYKLLRPNIMAIFAACKPTWINPEEVFKLAEERDPSGDLILVLHARYLWFVDRNKSHELWSKARVLARNPYLFRISTAHLIGGVGEGDDEDNKPLDLSHKTSLYAIVQLGMSRESNPRRMLADSSTNTHPSYSDNVNLGLNAQHWYRFGSVSANYLLQNDRFYSAHRFDFIEQNLEIPVAVRVGPNEDLIFKPFGELALRGGHHYNDQIGVGLAGAAYRLKYKQSVQASIYHDKTYTPRLMQEAGLHYQFDYIYEFFPTDWYIKAIATFQHVTADKDTTQSFDPNTIVNSHSDLIFQTTIQHDFPWFGTGLFLKFAGQQNSDDSAYISPKSGNFIYKQRSDFAYSIQPNLNIPLTTTLRIYMWYAYDRVISNMGRDDYADKNFRNETVGLAFRTFVSNY